MTDTWESTPFIEEVWESQATGITWATVFRDGGAGGGGAVDSVNGQTGVVVLDAADVGALPDDTVIPDITGLVETTDPRLSDARTPTAHTHNASAIDAGTVATARLGTGTANSGTYLRGDQTWAAVPSGIADPGGANDDFLQRKSGAWTNRTVAQVRTDLGVPFHISAPVGEWVGMSSPNVSAQGAVNMILSAAGRASVCPIWLPDGTFDRIAVIVESTGTATLRLGLYTASATTGLPSGTPALDAGTISAAGSGLREITISATLTAGWYWACVLCDAYTSTFSLAGFSEAAAPFLPGIPSSNATPGRQRNAWSAAGLSTGALPTSFSGSQWNGAAPKVILRRSA